MPAKKPPKNKVRFNDAEIKLLSALTNRAAIAARLGKSYGDDRDLYEALGYKTTPTFNDYMARYRRQDVAKAVINKPVDASWRVPPRVTELDDDANDFEDSWNELVKQIGVYRQIVRADKLAGVGDYSILLMGFDDSSKLSEEVLRANALLYLQPYSQSAVTIKSSVTDSNDARFGLPEIYQIDVKDGTSTMQQLVHHSRVIHIAEELLEDNVKGLPKLEGILNRLEDLERVVGGSAEMFWRGAFPGMGLKADEGYTMQQQDLDELQAEMEEYLHGLKRYIRLKGISAEEFAQQVADPSNHASTILDLISAATGIPKRILLGSERGELASSMDEKNWLQVVDARRKNYCEPAILRPLIGKLISYSVLKEPKDGYAVEWSDLMAPSDKEVADVGATRAKALKDYVDSDGGDMVLPPEVFLRKGLGLTDDDVEVINEQIADIGADDDRSTDDEE